MTDMGDVRRAATDITLDAWTDRARSVLVVAREEADKRGHRYVGTEHLLLALVGSGGIADGLLESFGVTVERVTAAVDFVVGGPTQ